MRWAAVPAEKREGGQNVPRPIDHYVVKVFKSRLNGKTVIGFHCHCGHESKVQFPDYRAMTLLRIRTVPDNICDLVLAAWRAHTKDLDGVHPNAEDQIRDFFTRQLEQPGGPTMTAPRYPLTAIPLNTPKPKSIAISAYVDEALRGILVDYAEKLGIDVDPMGTAEWDVANGPDRPWYASANVATATAMREYLARLLYGDDGLVENLQADEANINEKLDEVVAELRREEAEQPISFPNEVSPPLAIATETRNDFANDPELTTKQAPSSDRPTRIILRSYAADDKPRIERLLGLARQLQIPVQLAGPWSCTAFPKGEEAHPALDVVFPEVLVHPRDVLVLGPATSTYESGRSFGEELAYVENRLLWAAREDDQRFITGLIELLGLHADASRADIAAAVEAKGLSQPTAGHPGWMECLALSDRVRNILGAVDGEETDEAARRFVEEQKKVHSWRDSVFALRTETAENQRKLLAILNAGTVDPSWQRCLDCAEARMANARKFEEDVNAALGIHPAQSPHSALQRAKWLKEQDKYQTEQLNAIHVRMLDILGPNAGIAWPGIFDSVEKAVKAEADNKELEVKLSQANLTLERLRATLSATEKDRDALKERLETAITAERQTIAQRIDLALTGNAVVTNLDTVLRVVEYVSKLLTLIADALDAPSEEKAFTNDDGSLNTALVDRIVGYYKRLYTAAGYSEPPQGGWEELLTHIRKYTGFKPETPVTWPKYLIKPDNSKE